MEETVMYGAGIYLYSYNYCMKSPIHFPPIKLKDLVQAEDPCITVQFAKPMSWLAMH